MIDTLTVGGWELRRVLATRSTLLVAAGIAGFFLALAGTVAALLLVHATEPEFPLPDIWPFLALWAVLVVPAGVLLAGASFLAGTLAPRRGLVVKTAVVLVWIALAAVVDLAHTFVWYQFWSPAGNALLGVVDTAFVRAYVAMAGTATAADPAIALRAQQTPLDLHPWILPHLGLVAIGLAAAAGAAAGFRRFRGLV